VYNLAFIPSCLLLALLVLLIRRRAYAVLPCFFVYVVFAVSADAARFIVRNHASSYYGVYWATEACYDVLGILVMYEVLRRALGSLGLARRTNVTFPFAVVVGLTLGIARSRGSASHFGHELGFWIVTGEIAVRFVQVIVFAGLVFLVRIFGLRWKQYPFGVSTGFGLYSTVMLLTTVKFSDFGTKFRFLWGWTSLVAYSLAVLIWIWFFSAPQKKEIPGTELSAPSPADLKQYKNALRRMR
jgi:hypothetical protein